jgi:hypothetical protein
VIAPYARSNADYLRIFYRPGPVGVGGSAAVSRVELNYLGPASRFGGARRLADAHPPPGGSRCVAGNASAISRFVCAAAAAELLLAWRVGSYPCPAPVGSRRGGEATAVLAPRPSTPVPGSRRARTGAAPCPGCADASRDGRLPAAGRVGRGSARCLGAEKARATCGAGPSTSASKARQVAFRPGHERVRPRSRVRTSCECSRFGCRPSVTVPRLRPGRPRRPRPDSLPADEVERRQCVRRQHRRRPGRWMRQPPAAAATDDAVQPTAGPSVERQR